MSRKAMTDPYVLVSLRVRATLNCGGVGWWGIGAIAVDILHSPFGFPRYESDDRPNHAPPLVPIVRQGE